MSMFLESRKTTPSSLGHVILTGVTIGAAVLMFAPNLLLRMDAQSISVGDKVDATSMTFRGTIESIENGMVHVRHYDGRLKTFPVDELREM